MALNRTWFNNLVDDDGSNTVGTVWNKAQIAALLDSVDAEIANHPYCRVAYSNANGQSIGSGAWVTAPFDTAMVNVGNMWSSGQDTHVTVKVAGTYFIQGYTVFASNATGFRGMRLVINGSYFGFPEQLVTPVTGAPTALRQAGIIQLSANEFVEIQVIQTSGAALTAGLGFPNTHQLSVSRLF